MALYQIYFYVPKKEANRVKEAMFKAGAGRIGDYEYCSWECEGIGQFKPKEGANPHIGKVNKLEFVKELKVEMVCEEKYLEDVVKALLKAHPYEEVAYGVIELKTIPLTPKT